MTHHPFLWVARLSCCLGGALLCTQIAFAQSPDDPEPAIENIQTAIEPLDDITTRSIVSEHPVLAYAPIRESDILWEKRIWRIIDTREKMNKPFVAPESSFFQIISQAALAGDLPVYSTEDDKFSKRLTAEQVQHELFKVDTVIVFEPETYSETVKIVQNEINWEDIKRFRLKESWYFDKNTASLKVRILGIAPLIEVRNEEGDFLYEKPIFWVYYPSARPLLARNKVVNWSGNFASTTTWEDWFEMRYFSAQPIKENNVFDRRIQDYLVGADAVAEGQKIDDRMFNAEHDLWSW
jgi:gliding motility associated protien GldN